MTPGERWRDAVRAACLLALEPAMLAGAVVRARPGPVRDRWLQVLTELEAGRRPIHRLPANIDLDGLAGGFDPLAAVSGAGPGLGWRAGALERASPGVLVVPMAERMEPAVAAVIARAVRDRRAPSPASGTAAGLRLTVIALDESDPEDGPVRHALADTLPLVVDLDGIDRRSADALSPPSLADARARWADTTLSDEALGHLCTLALRFGVPGLWLPLQASRAARAAAALSGFAQAGETELGLVARLVFAPRAVLPGQPGASADEEASDSAATTGSEASPAPTAGPPDGAPRGDASPTDSVRRGDRGAAAAPHDGERPHGTEPPRDPDRPRERDAGDAALERLVDITRAAIPAGLLARLDGRGGVSRSTRARGRAAAGRAATGAGRPVGARRGRPGGGRRLHVLETLRAALPMQGLRLAASDRRGAVQGVRRAADVTRGRIRVSPDDLRVQRSVQRPGSVLIAIVDASGSSAAQRLGEAKGAIERLLADCYVRRDAVALIAFRGRGANLLLPPTRSLTRARRELARMPGGGGTPLAAGLSQALALSEQVRRDGRRPVLVLLTDGRANVALDGEGGRERARDDALRAARAVAARGLSTLVIDTSARPGEAAGRLAGAMGAQCLALPQADSRALEASMRAHRDRS